MNKTLRQATKDEIANAYINKVPLLIYSYRKASLGYNIDFENGEVETFCRFGLPMATRYNLGFEFRIWSSNKKRKQRLLKRVSRIVKSEKAIFLTLTFNDSFFARSTSETTRRRYISRFLKEQCSYYVANVDYGDKNGREHYHALVIPKNDLIDYKPYLAFFNKSCIYAERVDTSESSQVNISLYISKLTNHALKTSGRYKRLIYSRN